MLFIYDPAWMYHTFIFSSFLTWHQMEKTEGRLEKKVAKIFFFFIKFIEPRKTKKEDERRKKVRVNQEFLPLLPLCLHVYLSNQIWIRRASQVVSRSYILEKVFFCSHMHSFSFGGIGFGSWRTYVRTLKSVSQVGRQTSRQDLRKSLSFSDSLLQIFIRRSWTSLSIKDSVRIFAYFSGTRQTKCLLKCYSIRNSLIIFGRWNCIWTQLCIKCWCNWFEIKNRFGIKKWFIISISKPLFRHLTGKGRTNNDYYFDMNLDIFLIMWIYGWKHFSHFCQWKPY